MPSDSTKTLLQATSLTKDFGNGKGIFSVDLTLSAGEIMGFVGPNGAGKSTMVNILTGLIKPDGGSFDIFGELQTFKNIFRSMPRIGVMYSELAFSEDMTPKQIFVQSQEILGKDYTANWMSLSETLDLDIHKTIKKLSLGNKKKVGVVHALMHQPDLIIMDEPTSGLDPLIRDRFLSLMKAAAERGAAILLSSHDLSEIQEVSDNVTMIKSGKIIISDSTATILSKSQRVFHLINPSSGLMQALKKQPYVSGARKTGPNFIFQTNQYEDTTKLITDSKFYDFFVMQPSLEETFKEYYE